MKVTYFLAKGTVDELLWPLVRQKMKLLGTFSSRFRRFQSILANDLFTQNFPSFSIAGEIVEGSKDLDFSAATEESNSEVFGGFGTSGSNNSNSSSGNLSSLVGIKRERTTDSSALIKDEELGGKFLRVLPLMCCCCCYY